jgi:very-short-patch-repair endonuclease
MRYNISKNRSTKAERIVYELLKELKIPFKHRWIIDGCEIDFVIGKHLLEIDGHLQDSSKNNKMFQKGYIPIHFTNQEIITNRKNIKQWLEQISLQKERAQKATKSMLL